MIEMPELNDPWLIAAWPGMGHVASTAGQYLAAQLKMRHVGSYPLDRYFEMTHIQVEHGLARPGRRPRCLVFVWHDPHRRHDLVLLLAEAQPETRGYELCQELINQARQWNVSRVIGLAAMATQMHPDQAARVFGVATHQEVLAEFENLDVQPLDEGQISGLNGLTLAAAQEVGMQGACLLGELPYFAVQVPNPKASRVALAAIDQWLELGMDFSELDEQAEQIDQQLTGVLEQLQQQAGGEFDEDEGFTIPGPAQDLGEEPSPELDPQARKRIESLFNEAEQDRSKAFELKRELDRLGVFRQYEDRFLDLFKRGE